MNEDRKRVGLLLMVAGQAVALATIGFYLFKAWPTPEEPPPMALILVGGGIAGALMVLGARMRR